MFFSTLPGESDPAAPAWPPLRRSGPVYGTDCSAGLRGPSGSVGSPTPETCMGRRAWPPPAALGGPHVHGHSWAEIRSPGAFIWGTRAASFLRATIQLLKCPGCGMRRVLPGPSAGGASSPVPHCIGIGTASTPPSVMCVTPKEGFRTRIGLAPLAQDRAPAVHCLPAKAMPGLGAVAPEIGRRVSLIDRVGLPARVWRAQSIAAWIEGKRAGGGGGSAYSPLPRAPGYHCSILAIEGEQDGATPIPERRPEGKRH